MRRILLIVIGLLAALIGAALLSNAVDQARDDAAAGPGSVQVLVVQERIPRLTAVEDLGAAVALVSLPESAVVPGAVSDLETIRTGFVTTAALLPGEQVLADRFSAPQTVERLEVPEGLQEVTLAVPSWRALGGSVVVGDRVGVLGSFEDINGGAPVTDFVLHRVLVTAVQFSSNDVAQVEQDVNDTSEIPVALQGTVLVTFALSSQDANALVFAEEFGSVWLTRQDEAAEVGSEQPVTLESVFAGAQ